MSITAKDLILGWKKQAFFLGPFAGYLGGLDSEVPRTTGQAVGDMSRGFLYDLGGRVAGNAAGTMLAPTFRTNTEQLARALGSVGSFYGATKAYEAAQNSARARKK